MFNRYVTIVLILIKMSAKILKLLALSLLASMPKLYKLDGKERIQIYMVLSTLIATIEAFQL